MVRILIVEDELLCLEFLRITLEQEGYAVETASNGADAISLGQSSQPDILITDWRLKNEIDGLDVAKELQRLNDNLKVIVFSGSPRDELIEQARIQEISLFKALEKPLGLEDIVLGAREALLSVRN